MPRRGRPAAALIVTGLASASVLLLLLAQSPTAAERAAAGAALAAGVQARVTLNGSSLLAGRAIADFGIGAEVRLVRVRIVDELHIDVTIHSLTDVLLAAPIAACLVGPDPAPDDAGLSDRCWGDAELGRLLESALPQLDSDRYRLAAGVPVTVTATVRRGDVRCDYPPGVWRLELVVDPLVRGAPAGPQAVPDATFEIPFDRGTPLVLVLDRRYCGLASKVYREQGEPPIVGEQAGVADVLRRGSAYALRTNRARNFFVRSSRGASRTCSGGPASANSPSSMK